MASVTITPSGRTFQCEGKQTILDAALAAAIPLNYGCSQGTCGLCLARLLRGEVEKTKHHDFVFKQAQTMNGSFLLCANAAASPEVVIEATEALNNLDIPVQEINARIKKLARTGESEGLISVQTPRSARLRFLAGQNVRLTLKSGVFADLTIASCPCDDRNLEFHLNRPCNERFRQAVLRASLPMPVHIEGPWGGMEQDFGGRHTVCFAQDSHIANMMGWIEQQLAEETIGTIDLSWFALEQDRFYLRDRLTAWDDAFDTFSCRLIVLDEQSQIEAAVAKMLCRMAADNTDAISVLAAGPTSFLKCTERTLCQLEIPDGHLFIRGVAPRPAGLRP